MMNLMQTSESLYDQKPEEPVVQVSSTSASNNASSSALNMTPQISRFEYVDSSESVEAGPGGTNKLSHVAPPKSSSFFAEYGMESGFSKKSSSSSKVQVSNDIKFFILLFFFLLIIIPGQQ